MENQRIVLASRPKGWVTPDNFRLEKAEPPAPADGEVLVRNLWLSLDPYMRGRISEAKSYVKGVEIGEVMVGQTVGEVLESKHPALKRGDHVLTQTGWQLYGTTKEATKVDGTRAPLSSAGAQRVSTGSSKGWPFCSARTTSLPPGLPR